MVGAAVQDDVHQCNHVADVNIAVAVHVAFQFPCHRNRHVAVWHGQLVVVTSCGQSDSVLLAVLCLIAKEQIVNTTIMAE